jgi:DNA-binding YbaB/EbfC family protein
MAKGFNKPVGGGGQGGMMNQIRKMQEQMEQAQAELAEMTVSVSVGGGAIKFTITGDQTFKGVEIDPEFLKETDAEMLQDMLLSGVNLAMEKSRALQEEKMGPFMGLLGGLGL